MSRHDEQAGRAKQNVAPRGMGFRRHDASLLELAILAAGRRSLTPKGQPASA
jgi:hypothetical protein